MSKGNDEDTVQCPYCDRVTLKRGMFSHVFQSVDDAHGERYETPPGFEVDQAQKVGEEEVVVDYPEEVHLGETYYLDTYTGKAYEGQRGLMIHLAQMAGQDNIPEDVTERHNASDFPQVEIDDDGNITEVVNWPGGNVPPIEPYLPWFTDEEQGYILRQEVKKFCEELEEQTGAATAEIIQQELL